LVLEIDIFAGISKFLFFYDLQTFDFGASFEWRDFCGGEFMRGNNCYV
jgi:hypothetical protein